MDYQQICKKIFGTDDIEKLYEIAEKAHKYELECEMTKTMNERNAGRKPKIDCDIVVEIQEKYGEGKSVIELAKEYNVSRPTIYKYLNVIGRKEAKIHVDDTTNLL